MWRESDGEFRARYDVAHDLPLGTYRAHVESGRYRLTTGPFAVVASSALRVRGLTGELVGGQTRLDFVAQNPPPDPSRDILSRPRGPGGGHLRFQLGRRQLTALWIRGARRGRRLVPGDATAATVLVAPGALCDGLGTGPRTSVPGAGRPPPAVRPRKLPLSQGPVGRCAR